MTLFGDPSIRAGAPFPYSGVRPEVDAIEFIVETATHTLSKAGYTTEVEAKLKPEAGSGGGKAQGAGTGGAGSAANGSGEDNAGGGSTPPTAAPVPTIPAPGGIGSQ